MITKYYHIAKTNFNNTFYYLNDALMSSFFIGIIIFIFTQLWKAIYQNTTTIEGFTIVMMCWYFVMTESIVSSLKNIVVEIEEDIKSGNIANYLNKPYSYIAYKLSESLGEYIFRFFTTFIIGGLVVFFLIGGLKLNIIFTPLILIVVFLGMILHFFIMAFLGLFSF